MFCDCLHSHWQGMGNPDVAFDWPNVKSALEEDIQRITDRILY